MSKWRVGRGEDGEHPCNVYEGGARGNAYAWRMPSPEQAARICALLNEREQLREALIFAKADLIAVLLQSEGRDDYWWPSIDAVQKGIDAALAASEPSTPAK
jgi:hypothetical protein